MRMKNYVYSHPVNAFIIGELGISVEVFCELYGFKQGTLSAWVTRERAVSEFPISFLYALSLAAGETMDKVYDRLCEFEKSYSDFKKFNAKKRKKKRL